MHRALPVSNKILSKKWEEKNQRIHTEKLKNMQARVKSNKPVEFEHLKFKAKREQLLEDRFTEIERENRILLEKMSMIVNKKKGKEFGLELKSLNGFSRKEEMRRITLENHALLKRLQQKSPCYNSHQWEEDRKKIEKRLQNMCEFPYKLGRGGSTPVHFNRPKKLTPLLKKKYFSRNLEMGGELYKVEIKRSKRAFMIYIGKPGEKEVFSLKLGVKEALDLMGGRLDYDKLVEMLEFDNGEIVLVDNRDYQAENFGKNRDKYNKSREGARKKVKSEFIDMKSLNKSGEPGNNIRLPGLKMNENVHEEFSEDESSGNESEDKVSGSEKEKKNLDKGEEAREDEEEEYFDENNEYASGSEEFENESERSGKENINDGRNEVTEKLEDSENEVSVNSEIIEDN